jgi:hypothetical protein
MDGESESKLLTSGTIEIETVATVRIRKAKGACARFKELNAGCALHRCAGERMLVPFRREGKLRGSESSQAATFSGSTRILKRS